MNRKISMLLLCCLLGCFWTGCNEINSADVKELLDKMVDEEPTDEVSVLVRKDNTFTDVITESFTEDYYDLGELKEIVETEISTYNAAYPVAQGAAVPIELENIEKVDDQIILVLKYGQWSALQEYSADEAFTDVQMTAETFVNGMTLEGSFINAEGKQVDLADLNSSAIQKKYHKITTSGKEMTVYLENQVTCVSDNVTIVDDYTVQVPAESCVIVTH